MQQHRLHALCPYFAMFPPSFARDAILKYTKPGELVLDPFSGRGTTLLEALLLERRAIASDINPVAFCISAAKARLPKLAAVLGLIDGLERAYAERPRSSAGLRLPEFFSVAFHPQTLFQILFMRERLKWRSRAVDRFVAALLLAQLHGELDHSPNFFSNQMPHTISTKPAYSLRYWRRHRLRPPRRDVFRILREKAAFRLATGRPIGYARVACADARSLAQKFRGDARAVSAIVTSPPYLDVTAFEEDQWLRLWFLGGPPRPTWGLYSKDDRHRSNLLYWEFLTDAWQGVAPLLRRAAAIVCRIGSRRFSPDDLESRLRGSLRKVWSRVVLVDGPIVSRLRGSRAVLMQADSKGCRFEMDAAYRVA